MQSRDAPKLVAASNPAEWHDTNSWRYELFHENDVDFGCREEKRREEEAADRMRTV